MAQQPSEQNLHILLEEAARCLGKMKSQRKAASSRKNGKLGGRPLRPLDSFPCTCSKLSQGKHKSCCPRGRAIKRRLKKDKK